MKVLTIANLKGGVGKTVTTINASYLLATEHAKKVLLVDADQQGNTSQFFGAYGYDKPSMTDVMKRRVTAEEVIQHTEYENLDIIPANLSLAEAEKAVLMDSVTPQQVRLKAVLRQVKFRRQLLINLLKTTVRKCLKFYKVNYPGKKRSLHL